MMIERHDQVQEVAASRSCGSMSSTTTGIGALGLEAPDRRAGLAVVGEDQPGEVRRRDLLGGLLHDYRPAGMAAWLSTCTQESPVSDALGLVMRSARAASR
jgi:hypothetical protein